MYTSLYLSISPPLGSRLLHLLPLCTVDCIPIFHSDCWRSPVNIVPHTWDLPVIHRRIYDAAACTTTFAGCTLRACTVHSPTTDVMACRRDLPACPDRHLLPRRLIPFLPTLCRLLTYADHRVLPPTACLVVTAAFVADDLTQHPSTISLPASRPSVIVRPERGVLLLPPHSIITTYLVHQVTGVTAEQAVIIMPMQP